jgi:hypothetical protein
MKSSKRQITGSVLANISSEARSNFATRANNADKRRQQVKRAEQSIQRSKQITKLSNKSPTKATITKQKHKRLTKDWKYWLTQASFKEFIIVLFFPSYSKKRT